MSKNRLSHLNKAGEARMVDIKDKEISSRKAIASGRIIVSNQLLDLLRENGLKKGDALATARIAGIMAAKKTPDLIPLCHPLALTSIKVDLSCDVVNSTVEISAKVRLKGQTGVEMEALTAVSVAALTVYDMCKAIDRGMQISDIRLQHKAGGKSGEYVGP